MKIVKLLKFVSIFLSIATILIIIFFFFRNLVSKHHNIHSLFFSTYEFITGAKSSKLAVFAVFNVIVITVYFWRSKPPSAADFNDEFVVPSPSHVVHEVYNTEKEKENNEDYNSQDDKEHDEYHGYDGYDEDNDDNLDEEDVDSEDEITDIDLEKRIEEFISNVYKKWGEELLAERLLLLELAN